MLFHPLRGAPDDLIAEGERLFRSRGCAACHAAKPIDPTIKEAPKGVMLETLDDLRRYKDRVIMQAVNNRSMPLGNKTGMTAEERAKLGAWLAKQ